MKFHAETWHSLAMAASLLSLGLIHVPPVLHPQAANVRRGCRDNW